MAVIFSHGVVEIAVVIVVEIALMRMEIVVKIVKIVVEMMVKMEIVVVIVEIYWWRFCEEVDNGIVYSENRMVIVKEIVVKWW